MKIIKTYHMRLLILFEMNLNVKISEDGIDKSHPVKKFKKTDTL